MIRAYVLTKQNKPLKLMELEVPKLKYGQVLVKVLFAGICGTQIDEIFGKKGKDIYIPHLIGHEGSGEVIDIGPGVKKCSKGDLVVLHWRTSKGVESEFPYYYKVNNRKKRIGAGLITTFSDKTIISENRLTVIDKRTPPAIACLLGCSLTTAMGIINNNSRIKIGDSALVSGAGSLGQSIIFALNQVCCNEIYAIDVDKKKTNFVKKIGATHTFNNYESLVKKDFDTIIDTTGVPKVISTNYKFLKDFGSLIITALPKKDKSIPLFLEQRNQGKKIIDSSGGDTNPDTDIPKYINLILNKKIKPKKLIDKIIKPTQLNEYIFKIKKGKTRGKILVKFNA